jgi:histidyl-tRNA synthetase
VSRGFQSIPGTFDVLPDRYGPVDAPVPGSAEWRHVEGVVRTVLERFGAREIRTPVLEPTELIARGVGQLTDIVSKEMFAFERGDTQYVLRPELTAPVMRAYLEHSLDRRGGTWRLWYQGPCFRAERPQRGRYRQFHQFGAEVIGAPGAQADVEVIAMMMAVYRELGVTDTTLRINTLGDAESRPKYRAALQQYFEPLAGLLSETSLRRLETNPMRILDTKDPGERALLDDAPRLVDFVDAEALEQYRTVKRLLDDHGIAFEEDAFLVRGLDYYTHTSFELESPALGAQSALAGGGRYDLLALELGSRAPVPAVGFAAGFERLFLALDAAGRVLPQDPPPDVYVVALGEDAVRWAGPTANALRASGIPVVTDLTGRSMKAQLREADRLGVRLVVIVGGDELAASEAVVRRMADGSQQRVGFGDLARAVRELLA